MRAQSRAGHFVAPPPSGSHIFRGRTVWPQKRHLGLPSQVAGPMTAGHSGCLAEDLTGFYRSVQPLGAKGPESPFEALVLQGLDQSEVA